MGGIRSIIKSFYWKFNVKIFPNVSVLLRRELRGCKSFLDVGCGRNSPVWYFSKDFKSAGVDVCKESAEESREKGIHDEYFIMNARNLNFKPHSYEVVLALDLIEHLTKKEGNKLLKDMERIAKNKVIVYTPNGFVKQEEYGGNRYQIHKSGWTVSEMRQRGYRVIGASGVKFLRNERVKIAYPPKYFWWFVSDITDFFTYHFREYSCQLLCVKNVKKEVSKWTLEKS